MMMAHCFSGSKECGYSGIDGERCRYGGIGSERKSERWDVVHTPSSICGGMVGTQVPSTRSVLR